MPRERVARLQKPVLTIHGTSDRNAPYGAGREWAYLLPDARLVVLQGAAHQAFAERPEDVRPAIDEFLQGEWPASAEKVTADPRVTLTAAEVTQVPDLPTAGCRAGADQTF